MNYWKLLKNAGLFVKLVKDGVEAFKLYAKEHRVSYGLISVVIQDVEAILESGAVDIPGVDEIEISRAIENIRKNLES